MLVTYYKDGELVDAVITESDFNIEVDSEEYAPNGHAYDQMRLTSQTRYWRILTTVFAILALVMAVWR